MTTEQLTSSPIVKTIANVLSAKGKQCFIVGGAVRDSLLGLEAHDVDFTTDALPSEIVKIFEDVGFRTIDTGIKHGTVTVVVDGQNVEITTFRIDGDYLDHRRPETVEFTKSINDDLARRDFTINAIAVNAVTGEIVDPFGGIEDLKTKVVRTVGPPGRRFGEDGLRALRAIRFAAKFGFVIEQSTFATLHLSGTLELVLFTSVERRRDELIKGLATDNPGHFVRLLVNTGLAEVVVPRLLAQLALPQPKQYHIHDVLSHSIAALEAGALLTKDPFLRLVILLHDIGKPTSFNGDFNDPHYKGHEDTGAEIIEDLLTKLRFTNEEVAKAKILVQNHLRPLRADPYEKTSTIRRLVADVGEEHIHDLIILAKADLIAHGKKEEAVAAFPDFEAKVAKILEEAHALKVTDLKVNGYDALALGLKGPSIKTALTNLLAKVIESPEINTREALLPLLEAEAKASLAHV